jgi:hypothetical protein
MSLWTALSHRLGLGRWLVGRAMTLHSGQMPKKVDRFPFISRRHHAINIDRAENSASEAMAPKKEMAPH